MMLRCSEAAFVAFSLAQNCHSGASVSHFISWRMWHSETLSSYTICLKGTPLAVTKIRQDQRDLHVMDFIFKMKKENNFFLFLFSPLDLVIFSWTVASFKLDNETA